MEQTEARSEIREAADGTYDICWIGDDGVTRSVEASGVDSSTRGLAVECSARIDAGTVVTVHRRTTEDSQEAIVRHCTETLGVFMIGLEYCTSGGRPGERFVAQDTPDEVDYYEVLQISPNADLETIRRVFKIMAARFHPDNPETGDLEQFLRLKRAYSVLSDAERRAEYDAEVASRDAGPMPIFELKEFVTGIEAESNRRLGILSLLYNQRRRDPDHPAVSLLELETRMALPREHLSFTMWYLRAKQYATMADNSDYVITAEGTDYVEKNAGRNDLVSRLLTPGMLPRRDPLHEHQHAKRQLSRDQRHYLLPAGDRT